MKNSPLTPLLVGALFICGVAATCLSLWYVVSLREWQKLQVQSANINNSRNAFQSLANDAVEYSKRNPSLDPILEKFDIKSKAPAPAAGQPATKPAK